MYQNLKIFRIFLFKPLIQTIETLASKSENKIIMISKSSPTYVMTNRHLNNYLNMQVLCLKNSYTR